MSLYVPEWLLVLIVAVVLTILVIVFAKRFGHSGEIFVIYMLIAVAVTSGVFISETPIIMLKVGATGLYISALIVLFCGSIFDFQKPE